MAEEQTTPVVQDPNQQVTEPATQQPASSIGSGPWADSIRQAFQDPQEQARVDAFLRSQVQPHVTRLEQQNVEARQMYDAFNVDPDSAYIEVSRQLYGDEYAAALEQQRYATQQEPVQQYQQEPVQQYQQAPPAQAGEPNGMTAAELAEWRQERAERAYDEAKSQFLSDPTYADIRPELFDQFVQGAETWEEAAASYRSYAAAVAEAVQQGPPQPAPPVLGGQQGGAPSTTPALPEHESLNDAIDDIFAANKPQAPPM